MDTGNAGGTKLTVGTAGATGIFVGRKQKVRKSFYPTAVITSWNI